MPRTLKLSILGRYFDAIKDECYNYSYDIYELEVPARHPARCGGRRSLRAPTKTDPPGNTVSCDGWVGPSRVTVGDGLLVRAICDVCLLLYWDGRAGKKEALLFDGHDGFVESAGGSITSRVRPKT